MSIQDSLLQAFYIARKDMKIYYLKAPNFTYGLLMPVALYLAFGVAGNLSSESLISGLVSLVILFGCTSIEAVAVVMEKTSGTLERLLTAPVSPVSLILGKAIAGFMLGPITATIILVPVVFYSGSSVANSLLVFQAIALSSFTFASLGILISVYAKWIPEAQMYSNFLRFPMSFLSGAFIPASSMPTWLYTISRLLPLTYTIEAIKEGLAYSTITWTYIVDMLVLTIFSIVIMFLSTKALEKQLN